MKPKVTMKVSIEMETSDNSGNTVKRWHNDFCHDLENVFIQQSMHQTAYLFNWDAIVKRYYKELTNNLEDYEVFE
jgi:hypothetical protein